MRRDKSIIASTFIFILLFTGVVQAQPPVTVHTELTPDAAILSTKLIEAVVLPLSAEANAPGVILRWWQDPTSWFPTWELQLAAGRGTFGASVVDGTYGDTEYITLGTIAPVVGNTYRATLAYDPGSSEVSFRLVSLPKGEGTGEPIVSGHLELNTAFDAAAADLATIRSLLAQRLPHVEALSIDQGYERYGVPVTMLREFRWELVDFVNGEVQRKVGFAYGIGEEPGIRVFWPSRSVPGEVRFSVVQEGDRRQVASVTWSEQPTVITLERSALPTGGSQVEVEYVVDGRATVLDTGNLRLTSGRLLVRIAELKRDVARGAITGELVVSTEDSLAEVPLRLFAAFTRKGSAADVREEAVFDTTVDLSQGRIALPFALLVPPDDGELQFRFETGMQGITIDQGRMRFDMAQAPLAVAEATHEKISEPIGVPALLQPGDSFPKVTVYPQWDGVLSATVVHESGKVVAESAPRPVKQGEQTELSWTESAELLGEYTINVLVTSEGRMPFEDTFYFTVVSDDHPQPGMSRIVRFGDDGKLITIPDLRGNRIPDFSYVGYKGGGVPLPDVPVKVVVEPGPGDDTERIQAAIDEVAKLPLDENGFRGAVLLKKGIYEISGILRITASGIVLRGEGRSSKVPEGPLMEPLDPSIRNPEPPGPIDQLREKLAGETGTILLATGKEPADRVNYPTALHPPMTPLIEVVGQSPPVELPGTKRKITDWYVPVGSRSFHVERTDDLAVGDTVLIYRYGNAEWISEIGMDRVPPTPDGQPRPAWEAPWILVFDRTITAIEGNKVTVDVPLTNAIEQQWGGGELVKYTDPGRISNVGIENLRAISVWEPNADGKDDTRHVPRFLIFNNAVNVWAKDLLLEHFWATDGAITIGRHSKWVTLEDVVSLVAARDYYQGKGFESNFFLETNLYIGRYGARVEGQLAFINRMHVSNGRHPFVFGARVTGPNVFLYSQAYNTIAASEPHFHWSVGGLYDNVSDIIAIQDRLWFGGVSHGWSGANYVAWNTRGDLVNQWPPTAQNWAIGHVGTKSPGAHVQEKPELRDGYWESHGRHVLPQSLYLQQLKDRLGEEALEAIGYSAADLTLSPGEVVEKPWTAVLSGKPVLEIYARSQEQVEIPDSPALRLTGPLTLEALVRLDNNGDYGAIISKGMAAYEIGVDWRRGRKDSLQWRSAGVGTPDSFPGFFSGLSGEWVHVAVVYDGNEVRAYRDGELYGAVSVPPLQANTSKLVLGTRPGTDWRINGAIGYVRIWNVARTAEEIAGNIGNMDPSGPGLVANYRFDEGQGSTVHDSAGSHHGTIVGGTWKKP